MLPITSNELVSVVIPVFNAERFLAAAIHSVQCQTYPHVEIIVIDDGSTDRSLRIAEQFPSVRTYRQSNRGSGAARNAGVAHCRGKLLAFLDADDLWTQDKLARQVTVLSSSTNINFVTGQVEQFYEDGYDRGGMPLPEVSDGAVAGTLLIPAEKFHRVGGFNTELKLGEFMDWYSRAEAAGLVRHHLPSILLRRRIHGGNTVLRQRASRQDYLAAMKAHLDRKRRAA